MKEEINKERREEESVYYYTLMWFENKILINFPPQKFLDVLLKSDLVVQFLVFNGRLFQRCIDLKKKLLYNGLRVLVLMVSRVLM